MRLFNKNYFRAGLILCSYLFIHSVQAQSVYPDLDGILSCSRNYINNHFEELSNSKQMLVVPTQSLGKCELYKTTINDYSLVVEAAIYADKRPNGVHGYIVTKNGLGDNEIATLKHLATTSEGKDYSPAYLDASYNLITFHTETQIVLGVEKKVLIQETRAFPILKSIITNPDNNLILEILIDKK